MGRYFCLIVFLYVFPLIVNGQVGCKNRKPVEFDKNPFNTYNKLTCERFNHSISPELTKMKGIQIEAAISLSDVSLATEGTNQHESSTINAYSSLKIKFSVTSNFELSVGYSDLYFYSGDAYGGLGLENPYFRYTLGAKCILFKSYNRKSKLGLWCQMGFARELGQTIAYPELRVVLSRKITPTVLVTSNIGSAYTMNEAFSLLYTIEVKYGLTKKVELIVENFTDNIHLTSNGKPSNQLLFGIGKYLRESFYVYLTCEKSISGNSVSNMVKANGGLAIRF
jgi:hypothetical protein